MEQQTTPAFVKWFRDSSPYINAHRDRTFVLAISGEALLAEGRDNLIADITLLVNLGVRVVLVHGIEPQLRGALEDMGHSLEHHNGHPVTDDHALRAVRQSTGGMRLELEAAFSSGLASTHTGGNNIRVVSGNHVVARPLGVREGIDHLHSGEVRRLHTSAVRDQLDSGALVLLSPVGYSPSGEVFYVAPGEVAAVAAMELRADKLLFLSESGPLVDTDGKRVEVLTPAEAEHTAAQSGCPPEQRAQLLHAVRACRAGVRRAHLMARRHDGALLQELYSRDGVGTLITTDDYDAVRTARVEDIGGILHIISPLEAEGVLVQRSREQLELDIGHFVVMERDGMIIACASLHPFADEHAGELACVAVHPDYRDADRGRVVLQMLERQAQQQGIKHLFVLTTRTADWFREQGFEPARIEDLPVSRQALYNYQRKSKVFSKALG